ncbi:OB-fold domain-containing protein [Salicibibacter cibarius]|uniref:OB-fold domain-containing protein n=1 Tax=Salicibibacter cibarius TaxID=2743000 RepID=A0A7T7CBY1_9BACI|nr:OB-fold domain-containing protein [Salicibibacter cibarius]QQK76427.1 OB-fold domain-containing protein [Salicibibacter cibarius]
MVGITGYGAYIPFSRLKKKVIAEAYGEKGGSGEKAVANHDEDSLSMAVEAAIDAKADAGNFNADVVFFASTTPPYKEKQSSAIIRSALDFKRNIRSTDVTDSLRAASGALLSAADAVKSGEKSVLVTASDTRVGGAQGGFESLLGDGAAAFLIGTENVLATIEDSKSITVDITDQWRSSADDFLKSWEERFGVESGYNQLVSDAVHDLLTSNDLQTTDISKVILAGPKERYQKKLAATLGFSDDQVVSGHENRIGHCSTAQAPMLLVDCLEEAHPGDLIVMATYGSGSDAMLFKVTENIRSYAPRMGFAKQLQSKRDNLPYTTYLKWKNMLPTEAGRRPEIPQPSAPAMYRHQEQNLEGYGSVCTSCETPFFPKQHVCAECGAIQQMEPYKFTDKKGKVVTYTSDYLAVSPDPPSTFNVIDFEGGGRMICEMVDYHLDQLAVGMEVEMTFRHLYEAGSIHNYTWKVRPKR